MRFSVLAASAFLTALPVAGSAQTLGECDSGPVRYALEEGVHTSDSAATFAEGVITIFPVWADGNLRSSVVIGVLHPVPSDLADTPHHQGCTAIYAAPPPLGQAGYFHQAETWNATASYDPARGLTIAIPVQYWTPGTMAPLQDTLRLTINQQTGGIVAD